MRELPITKPSRTPTTMAMPKPAMVTQKVRQAWPAITSLNSMNCCQMREGLGNTNSETWKARHSTSQMTSVMTSRIQGDQRSSVFLFMWVSSSLVDHGAALAHGADVAAQLVHDVGELGGVGHLQVARSRQIDLALDHETAWALAHHIDGVGQEDRFAQVVRDQDHVEALLGPEVAQRAPQFLAGEGVERAEGLVEQQHRGLVDECAADAGALLHAARQLPGVFVFVAAQTHGLQQLAGTGHVLVFLLLEAGAGGLDDLQRQQNVVERAAPGQQRRGLKGHAADLEGTGDRLAVDQDAPFAGHLQAGGEFHEGGLAAVSFFNLER